MWIASKYGWFSIVKKDGGFHVRARTEADLHQLQHAVGGDFAELKVHITPHADYCCRIFIPGAEGETLLSSVMTALGDSVDYANFKSMIGSSPDQQGKLGYYHAVWAEMDRYQSEHNRSRKL
jgi:hypothetical protein